MSTKTHELISDPDYWARRLREAGADSGNFHHAVFKCPRGRWLEIEARHREILAGLVRPDDAVLDAGCGWGRLLDLLPDHWYGPYTGVDVSPDFIDLASRTHPLVLVREDRAKALGLARQFVVGDLRRLDALRLKQRYDWAVMISIRPMIRRHLGDEVWGGIERQLRAVATKLLYLEYDPTDGGSVE